MHKYTIIKELHRSNHSIINLAKYDKKTVILKQLLDRSSQREVSILKKIDSFQYIPSLLDSFTHDKYDYLVLPYYPGGDVATLLRNNKISHSLILSWFLQIAQALMHCHTHQILHRNISLSNMFLTADYSTVVLANFGLAVDVTVDKQKHNSLIGTPCYLAPEIFTSASYSHKSDIWALGCLLYELVNYGKISPFSASNLDTLSTLIQSGQYKPLPAHIDKDISNIINSTLCVDPTTRIKLSVLINAFSSFKKKYEKHQLSLDTIKSPAEYVVNNIKGSNLGSIDEWIKQKRIQLFKINQFLISGVHSNISNSYINKSNQILHDLKIPKVKTEQKLNCIQLKSYIKTEQKPKDIQLQGYTKTEQKPKDTQLQGYTKTEQKPKDTQLQGYTKTEQKPKDTQLQGYTKTEQKPKDTQLQGYTKTEQKPKDTQLQGYTKTEQKPKDTQLQGYTKTEQKPKDTQLQGYTKTEQKPKDIQLRKLEKEIEQKKRSEKLKIYIKQERANMKALKNNEISPVIIKIPNDLIRKNVSLLEVNTSSQSPHNKREISNKREIPNKPILSNKSIVSNKLLIPNKSEIPNKPAILDNLTRSSQSPISHKSPLAINSIKYKSLISEEFPVRALNAKLPDFPSNLPINSSKKADQTSRRTNKRITKHNEHISIEIRLPNSK